MEDQGQKNHVSGVETQQHHQVHHCHKCGWPFPKPHPSAKHRRAHKRVCGTLEGYKLQDSSYTIVSDDDHSDDGGGDYKSPQISVKRLERSPSEDDVYSDAVSNFTDASPNSGVGGTPEIASESASAAEKLSEVVVPEFSAFAEGAPSVSLTCSVPVQGPMIAPPIDDESGNLSSTIAAETKPDFPKGAPKDKESDAESLVGLLTEDKSPPIENDDTAKFSPNDEVKVIEQLSDTYDVAESMLQATDEVSAIADPKDPFAQSVETPNGKLVSETPQKDISLERSAVQESEVSDFGKADKGVHMHLFHVPHDVPAVEHPEKFIEGFKHHPKKGISDEETSLEDVTLKASREDDSIIPGNNAEEVTSYASEADNRSRNVPCVAPDSVSVIETTTHIADECLLSGTIKEEEFSDVMSDTASVLSLDSGAPRTTFLDRKYDSSNAVEIVSTGITGDGNDKNVVDKIPAFLSSEAPPAVGDGYVSSVEIHHPISDAVTVTIKKGSAEEQEVSGTVDTRALNLDTEGDNTLSAVETSEFDGTIKDVEFAYSSSSPPVTEKLSGDIENGTKAEEEGERFVGHHSRVIGDFAASEIHVAEDDGVRKEAAAEESGVQISQLAVRSSLDDSVEMENREVAVVESRRKSAANKTITDGGLGAETTTTTTTGVVDEVVAEKEQLNKGDEVEGDSSSSLSELGDGTDKKAVLLPVVGTVSQVPKSLTVAEEGGNEASLEMEDGPKQNQQQLTASVLDASSSPSDSLDANWGGFVSVLSTQSDTMTPTDEPKEVGKPNTKQQQQHSSSPLKNLLVEANRETKPISPILKENINGGITPPPTTTKVVEEEKKKKDSSVKEAAAATSEEWNSPARYPSEIKRDKKVKGRPYWAQFVCCSSGGG